MSGKEHMYTIISDEGLSSVSDGAGIVPAFLTKLWRLVDDEESDDLISWYEDGTSFIVYHPNNLAKDLLPYYFKHNNYSSFVRQLNMYGFKKMSTADSGGLRSDREEMIFQHPLFVKKNRHLLGLIKRKVSKKEVDPGMHVGSTGTSDLKAVLGEVNQMKAKQTNLNAKLLTMKRENEALWQELADLRKKHNNQQTIVQRLIQFLIKLASAQRAYATPKRKLPLMMIDSPQSSHGGSHGGKAKAARFTRQISVSEQENSADMDTLEDLGYNATDLTKLNVPVDSSRITDVTDVTDASDVIDHQGLAADSSVNVLPSGIVLAGGARVKIERSGETRNEYIMNPDHTAYTVTSPASTIPDYTVESPGSMSANVFEPLLLSPGIDLQQSELTDNPNLTDIDPTSLVLDTPQPVTSPSTPSLLQSATSTAALPNESDSSNNPVVFKRSVSTDVDALQLELDSLRDMLATGQFTLDASTLNGVGISALNSIFSPDLLMMSQEDNMLRNLNSSLDKASSNTTGNEVVRYNEPSYPDLLKFVESSDDLEGDLDPSTSNLYSDDVLKDFM